MTAKIHPAQASYEGYIRRLPGYLSVMRGMARAADSTPQLFHRVMGKNLYSGPRNQTIQLETGKSPGGQDISGQWGLRDKDGDLKAWDKDLKNLAERWGIKLVEE